MSLISKKKKLRKGNIKNNINTLSIINLITVDNGENISIIEDKLFNLNAIFNNNIKEIGLIKSAISKIAKLLIYKKKKVLYKPFENFNFIDNIIDIITRFNDNDMIDECLFISSNLLYVKNIFENKINILNYNFNHSFIKNYLCCVYYSIDYMNKDDILRDFNVNFFNKLIFCLKKLNNFNEKLFNVIIQLILKLIQFNFLSELFTKYLWSIIYIKNHKENQRIIIYELIYILAKNNIFFYSEYLSNLIIYEDFFNYDNEKLLLNLLKLFIEHNLKNKQDNNSLNKELVELIKIIYNRYLKEFDNFENELNNINSDFFYNLINIIGVTEKDENGKKFIIYSFYLILQFEDNQFYIDNFINNKFLLILKDLIKLNYRQLNELILNLINRLFIIGDSCDNIINIELYSLKVSKNENKIYKFFMENDFYNNLNEIYISEDIHLEFIEDFLNLY